jgi:hypothetical protein
MKEIWTTARSGVGFAGATAKVSTEATPFQKKPPHEVALLIARAKPAL